LPRGFAPADAIVVGSVGRLDPVKDPLALLSALRRALELDPGVAARLRVVLVGGVPPRERIDAQVGELGVATQCWIAGERADIRALMQAFEVFALCSLNEGISNTILEAMASGLPVVATRVGGNVELVQPDVTGTLCDGGDVAGLAAALLAYARDPALLERHGRAARAIVEKRCPLAGMIERYAGLYWNLLVSARARPQN
jgi:glycosyltransferase involved in cell wall biosynthesis